MIVFTNNKEELPFSYPIKLSKQIDLSGLTANHSINTEQRDGGDLLSTFYNTREIEIRGIIDIYKKDDDFVFDQKQKLYRMFDPKVELKMSFQKNGENYYIKGFSNAFPVFVEEKNANAIEFLIELVCVDSLIYKEQTNVNFSSVDNLFEFPLVIEDDFISVGEMNTTLIKSIYNESPIPSPIVVKMRMKNAISNPYVLNIYTGERIDVKSSFNQGDELLIDTGRAKKIVLIRNNTEYNYYSKLDINSDFLQLQSGENVIRVGAGAGEIYLDVSIEYSEMMGGL